MTSVTSKRRSAALPLTSHCPYCRSSDGDGKTATKMAENSAQANRAGKHCGLATMSGRWPQYRRFALAIAGGSRILMLDERSRAGRRYTRAWAASCAQDPDGALAYRAEPAELPQLHARPAVNTDGGERDDRLEGLSHRSTNCPQARQRLAPPAPDPAAARAQYRSLRTTRVRGTRERHDRPRERRQRAPRARLGRAVGILAIDDGEDSAVPC